MNLERVQKIADAVLYEGYMLYPYRSSSVKNRQRWTFGGLYPEAYTGRNGDSSSLQTEVIVEGGAEAVLDVRVRFLHLLSREQDGRIWQEGMEREVLLTDLKFASLGRSPDERHFSFPASGIPHQEQIDGLIEVSAKGNKLTIRVANTTAFHGTEETTRDEASMQALVSTHAILSIAGGEFISLTDPPEHFREEVAGCSNVGVWPVLVGEEGSHDCMLASPIILYDYPQVAPESAGDLFDGAEIDEILTLRILTMTDHEKNEMRQVDERTRRVLERTEALSQEQLMKLHGALRSPHA